MREEEGSMKIDGKTRICGLIGNPVEHTLSPLIHNTLAAALSHNLVYVPLQTVGGIQEVKAAIEGAYAMNILGLNVTVPHKEHVAAILPEADPLAAQIGAMNTLVRTQGGYRGYNTDMSGLYRAMRQDGIRIEGENILLLGAGGAARAVAYMLSYYGAGQVWLLNRTFAKAEKIAAEINRVSGREAVKPLCLEEYASLPEEKYIAVQATSVGLYPNCQEAVIENDNFYRRIHTGYDLIYRPSDTRFMQLVQKNGGKAYNGLKMLLYQGVEAYELWNDVRIDEKLCAQLYESMKREIENNA